jgi:hypothetical protein
MKPIRQQLKEALAWKSRFYSPRDFALTVIAGFAILYGIIFWMSGDSVRSPFDLKVAIGGFVVVGVCVLLASNRVFVLGCAVMAPAALVWFDAALTGNQTILAFCFADMAFGFLILVVGTGAKSLWEARSSRGSK